MRIRLNQASKVGAYFLMPKAVGLVPSGCSLLDCCLGGGWPLGRIINLVGDKSTGKTLLAIEACANFAAAFPKGKIFYREAEAAFDENYAEMLGLPLKTVDFLKGGPNTVEGLYKELSEVTKRQKKQPTLFIVDSLDALSDEAESARAIDKGSYGAEKARKLSEIFRRITKRVEASKLLLFIISQTRDKIGVVFGSRVSRSGGKALDFYASQIVYLAEKGRIIKTINKIKRPVGVKIRARVTKNKIGLPYRECEFDILFAYGVDSEASALEWLAEVGELHRVSGKLNDKNLSSYLRHLERKPRDEFDKISKRIDRIVREVWIEVEQKFMPTRRKY